MTSPRQLAHLATLKELSRTPEARRKISRSRMIASTSTNPTIRALFAAIDASPYTMGMLAKKAGTNIWSINSWRHGRSTPKITDVEALANVVGMTIAVVPLRGANEEADAT